MATPKPHEPQIARLPVTTTPDLVEEAIDVRAYLDILRKRWLSILAVAALVVAATAAYTVRQTPIYKASTSLIIDPVAPRILQGVQDVVEIGAGNTWRVADFYETEYEVIKSRQISALVVEKLGLDRDLQFLGLADIEDAAEQQERLERADAVGRLRSMISVEPVRDSRMVFISVSDTDPKRAAHLSVEIARAYEKHNLERRAVGAVDAIDWMDEQLATLRGPLQAAELALFEYREQHDMLDAPLHDRQNILTQRLSELNATLTRVRAERIQLESRMRRIRSLRDAAVAAEDGSRPAYDTLADVAGSLVVERLKQEYFRKSHEYAALSERYLDRHPNLLQAREGLQAARVQLDSEIGKIVASIENKYEEAKDAEAAIERELDRVRAQAHAMSRHEPQYNELLREKEKYERLYVLIQNRIQEAGVTGDQRANNVRVVDEAIVPTRPVSPRVRRNLALGGVLGLFLGVGLAFVREFLDNTVKNPDDVERELGVPFLGLVPEVADRAANKPRDDLHIVDHGRGQAAEACRSIRTNLLFMATDEPIKKVLVTSAGPREGKTTMVVDLGVVMAQSGSRVLLVDTDMRRPRLHKAFDLPNERGLTTLLLGESKLDEVVHPTEVDGLFVLPCGPIPPNPAEMLHTERFRAVLEEAGARYDRLILDSPPLGAVADAKVLSKAADGTLMVIKAHQTTKGMARHAVESLDDVNARVLGVVLGQVDLSQREYGDYYYYYRKYGSYYGADGEKPGKKGAGEAA